VVIFDLSFVELKWNSRRPIRRRGYREAVMSQSPGLLQPWVSKWTTFSTRNKLRQLDTTALRLNWLFDSVTQGCRSGNPGL
jgi:hypothetical protein